MMMRYRYNTGKRRMTKDGNRQQFSEIKITLMKIKFVYSLSVEKMGLKRYLVYGLTVMCSIMGTGYQ
jgi:hypothetical protein